VRVNLARAESGLGLDVEYLATLSADAAPALAALLTSDLTPRVLAVTHACYLRAEFRRLWGDEEEAHDWRSWNMGRARAVRSVALLELENVERSCG
jgi:hypothetical protein